MNRRGFLTLLGRGAAVAWIAPFLPDIIADVPYSALVQPVCGRCGRTHRVIDMTRDYIQPAAQALADQIDARLAQSLYLDPVVVQKLGAATAGLFVHRDAFAIVMAPLTIPPQGVFVQPGPWVRVASDGQ